MCTNPHPLHRCDKFRSTWAGVRGEFIKLNTICLNCINSSQHTSRLCKSSIRCRSPGCGKAHHTLLHRTDPPLRKIITAEVGTNAHDSADPHLQSNAVVCRSNEVLLKVISVKIVNGKGDAITTYGLIDSGSDVTFIDRSLVRELGVKGTTEKFFFSTVNSNDGQEVGLKVDFKISPIDGDSSQEFDVRGGLSRTLPFHSSIRQFIVILDNGTTHSRCPFIKLIEIRYLFSLAVMSKKPSFP